MALGEHSTEAWERQHHHNEIVEAGERKNNRCVIVGRVDGARLVPRSRAASRGPGGVEIRRELFRLH